jgi:phospholipid transport system substrate-binding protein
MSLRAPAVLLACLVVLTPAAGAAAQTPTQQLKAALDRVLKILEDPALKSENRSAERRAAVRRIADDIFDFREVARRALAQHWRPLSEEQRAEFAGLFSDLLERAYMSKIELYSGEPIRYSAEQVEGEFATVSTRLITKQSTEVPIDYRMLKRGDRWLVYDVNIEGVGLVSNYRTQFNSIIQKSSYADLVKKMKARVEELRAPQ